MCNRKYAALQSLKNHEKKRHKCIESNISQKYDTKLHEKTTQPSNTTNVIDAFFDKIDFNIPFDLIMADYKFFSNY